ncbi:MAG TPA: hypothetical protein VKB79_11165 [Bryobacteraceae bacterium]|nr:hypothetical protein [Bryobacteraceae bacterium]
MKAESAEQKYDRLRNVIHKLVLTAYPNPDRNGCPGPTAIEGYARRVAGWEKLDGDPTETHVQRCSPCYREFLDAGNRLRAARAKPTGRMSWFQRRRMKKTLDQLEKVMQTVAERIRETRRV